MTHSPSQAPDTPEPGNYSQTANQARPRENSSTPPRLLSPQASHRHPQGGTDHARNSGHLGGETHPLTQTQTQADTHPQAKRNPKPPHPETNTRHPRQPPEPPEDSAPRSHRHSLTAKHSTQRARSPAPRLSRTQVWALSAGPEPTWLRSRPVYKRLLREREGRRWGSRGGGNAKSGWGGPQPPAEERQHTLGFITTPGPSTVLSQESEVPPQPTLTASCPPP